jgi:RimJ/RimL family protein N-acetyltransferase
MTDPVETTRLTLRRFQDADVDALYDIQRDPDAMRYTYCAPSRADAEQRLKAYADLLDELEYAPWTVILRAESRIIGWGGLNVDPFDPGWGVEVAYFFHPASYWGRGFATELVQTSLEQGFAQHNLETIGAFTHRENVGAIRVLEKCGFRFTGFEPQLNRNRYRIDRAEWSRAVNSIQDEPEPVV